MKRKQRPSEPVVNWKARETPASWIILIPSQYDREIQVTMVGYDVTDVERKYRRYHWA